MKRISAAVAIIAAVCTGWGAAFAQSDEPIPLIDLPTLSEPEPEPAPAPAPGALRNLLAANSPPAFAPPDNLVTPRLVGRGSALVNLADDGVLRLSGERVVARLVVDLSTFPDDLPFRLTYRNSINVLPEMSEIRILINGNEASVLQADAFGAFQTVDIPAPVLMQGENLIVVEATHSHRIFCGVDASFQIWTEIDLASSGVLLPPTQARSGLSAVLSALSASAGDEEPVVIRAAPDANRPVARALAERIGQLSGGRPVRVGTPWDPAIDSPPEPRIVLEAGAVASVGVVTGADGASVLRIVHSEADPADPAAALPPLSAHADREHSFSTASSGVSLLVPGAEETIESLGFSQTANVASYIVETVSFRLPKDWLSLASQQGHLFLNYRFPAGLPPGANLLIKANGTTIRELPLDRDGGRELPTLDVGFLAALLGPGVNRIDFEAIIEAEDPELPCPPWPDAVLTIEPTSVLVVPAMPSMYFDGMERGLPSLSAAGLRYDSVEDNGNERFDNAERTEIAVAVGYPADGVTQTADETTLNIVLADDYTSPLSGELGMTRRRLSGVLAAAQGAGTASGAGAPGNGVIERVMNAPTRMAGWFTGLALPGGPPLDAWLSNKSAVAILLQPTANRPNDITLILGSEVEPVDVARTIVADRLDSNGPRGRVALLTPEGQWQIWRPPFDPPRLSGPVTPGNLRVILGNYASWSPIGFAAVLFLLTLVSALIAIIYLRRTRDERY